MSEVSAALQGIRKGDGTDTQPVLHLVELLKSRDTSHLPQLLTLSPSCSEVFSWWDRGPGQHTQSAASFTLFALLNKSVLKDHPQFQAQAVALCRKIIKERLHSVYSCLSKYSSVPARKRCLEFLILLNCFGGSVTKTLLDDFNFGNASLKQMLANHGPAHEDAVRFMLSFLCIPSLDLKVKFMQMKNVLKIMTTRIGKDSVELKMELLNVLLEHVLNVTKIQKRVMCQFFAVPVLVKISYFWEDSKELQEQTSVFFRALFHRKTGILFDSTAKDVLTDCSRNPVLLNFVKHASSNSECYSEFVADMVKICPEVSSSMISSIITKKSSDLSFASDLCSVLRARDVEALLSTVTPDITDKQIIDYLVPKPVSDLLEKQLKTTVDIGVYPLLLALIGSASKAVAMLQDREQLKDIALFNLVDISVINSAGLLTSALAGHYSIIDMFSLHQYKLEKLIDLSGSGELSEDDVNLLVLTYPAALRRFVKSNHAAVVKKVLEKTGQSKKLFHKIMLAVSSDVKYSKAINIIESIIFDDHSDIIITIKGEKRDFILDEEIPILVNKICDFSTSFGLDYLTTILNGLNFEKCDMPLLGKAEYDLIPLLIAYICNSCFVGLVENWEFDLREKLLSHDSPVFLLGSEFAQDVLWEHMENDYYEEIRRDPILVANMVKMFQQFSFVLFKNGTENGTRNRDAFHHLLQLFDDNLMTEMHNNPKVHEKTISYLQNTVDQLIERNHQTFYEVDVLKCVIMKEWLTEKRVEAVIQNVLMSESIDDRKDDELIPTIRNHLDKFAEFCGPRSYLPTKLIYFGMYHFFDLFQSLPEKIDEYHIIWFLHFLGKNGALCSDIFSHIPQEIADKMYSELCSDACVEYITKNLSDYSNIYNSCDAYSLNLAKHSRFQCILLLENYLCTKYSKQYDYVFDVSKYKEHKQDYQEYSKEFAADIAPVFALTVDDKRVCLFSEIICKTEPNNESEALYLVSEAINLECTTFFTSRHFDKTAELSSCLKSKKLLKQIFELFMSKSDIGSLRAFLSQHVSVYEEHLPAFTRKQIDKSVCSTVELLDQTIVPETSQEGLNISIEILTQLIITFQEIVPGERLSPIFDTLTAHPAIQKSLVSALSSEKTLLTKLFVLLLETGKVPPETLNKAHYLIFQTSYSATTSVADKNVLKILKHFEEQGVKSKYPFAYGSDVADLKSIKNIAHYNEYCIKILENIDSDMMNNLIDNFPLHSEESMKMVTDSVECQVSADPEYILSLLHHVLRNGEVDVRMILSHPISKVMLLALSSYDEATRRVAFVCLERTSLLIEEEKFKEKAMCLYLFKMIENSITSVEERLPHLSVYFLGRMLHALFTPHKHIYQTICHFLLQRPVFDFHDVPMFYGMFCSSNLHFRQDQNWLLEILCVAVRDEIDYKILTRRHVLPHCFSQISCHNLDKHTLKLIHKLLKKVFSIKSVKVQNDLADLGITAID